MVIFLCSLPLFLQERLLLLSWNAGAQTSDFVFHAFEEKETSCGRCWGRQNTTDIKDGTGTTICCCYYYYYYLIFLKR